MVCNAMSILKLQQLCEDFELSDASKKGLEGKLQELIQSAKSLKGNVHTSQQQRWFDRAYQAGVKYRDAYSKLRKAGEVDTRYDPIEYMLYYHYSKDETFYLDDLDSSYFFTCGFEREPKPEIAVGYRFGKFGKKSYNYRDDRPEQGVSVFYVEGETVDHTVVSTTTLWWGGDVYRVNGWLMNDVYGSDGEPMILPCWEDGYV